VQRNDCRPWISTADALSPAMDTHTRKERAKREYIPGAHGELGPGGGKPTGGTKTRLVFGCCLEYVQVERGMGVVERTERPFSQTRRRRKRQQGIAGKNEGRSRPKHQRLATTAVARWRRQQAQQPVGAQNNNRAERGNHLDTSLRALDGRERLAAELQVYPPPREVVHHDHVVAVSARRPHNGRSTAMKWGPKKKKAESNARVSVRVLVYRRQDNLGRREARTRLDSSSWRIRLQRRNTNIHPKHTPPLANSMHHKAPGGVRQERYGRFRGVRLVSIFSDGWGIVPSAKVEVRTSLIQEKRLRGEQMARGGVQAAAMYVKAAVSDGRGGRLSECAFSFQLRWKYLPRILRSLVVSVWRFAWRCHGSSASKADLKQPYSSRQRPSSWKRGWGELWPN